MREEVSFRDAADDPRALFGIFDKLTTLQAVREEKRAAIKARQEHRGSRGGRTKVPVAGSLVGATQAMTMAKEAAMEETVQEVEATAAKATEVPAGAAELERRAAETEVMWKGIAEDAARGIKRPNAQWSVSIATPSDVSGHGVRGLLGLRVRDSPLHPRDAFLALQRTPWSWL